VCWHTKKNGLESGPVTADLTTPVVHSSKLLVNDVEPNHLLTICTLIDETIGEISHGTVKSLYLPELYGFLSAIHLGCITARKPF